MNENTNTPEITNDIIIRLLRSQRLDVSFLVEAGSRSQGTDTPESDRDLVGFYAENDSELFGLREAPRKKYRVRETVPFSPGTTSPLGSVVAIDKQTGVCLQDMAAVGNKPDRALPTDVEVLLLPLRDYVRLAAAGNIEFLAPLFTDLDGPSAVIADERARFLVPMLREILVTLHAAKRTAGYAAAQRAVVLGKKNRRTNRSDLVTRHGYDTKAGSHLLRLLIVGHRLMTTRAFDLPMLPEEAEEVKKVRRGEVPLDALITTCDQLERLLVERIAANEQQLPDEAPMDEVDELLTQALLYPRLAEARARPFEHFARVRRIRVMPPSGKGAEVLEGYANGVELWVHEAPFDTMNPDGVLEIRPVPPERSAR